MYIPLTRYGCRELVVIFALMIVLVILLTLGWPSAVFPWGHIILLVLLGGGITFFRNPDRVITDVPGGLLAPADGKVTDICQVEESEFLGGRALRIGIFLSVLDVHVNRAPCGGKVAYMKYHPGKCLNAMRSEAASARNTANSMGVDCPEHPVGKLMVKQITGAIARRIVCGVKVGDDVASGEVYGMIKFGSRTELFIPAKADAEVLVKVGDTVRAGITILAKVKRES